MTRSGRLLASFLAVVVSLGQGGEGLGAMWGQEKARELLNEAGFEDVDVKEVEGDIFNFYYICKRD